MAKSNTPSILNLDKIANLAKNQSVTIPQHEKHEIAIKKEQDQRVFSPGEKKSIYTKIVKIEVRQHSKLSMLASSTGQSIQDLLFNILNDYLAQKNEEIKRTINSKLEE